MMSTIAGTALSVAPQPRLCSNASLDVACGDVARAGAHLDAGAERIAWRLHSKVDASVDALEPVRILVMGNSVARWNKYHTSQTFRSVLQAAFPRVVFTTSTSAVEGGFGPEHQLSCGRGEWLSADIVLVHFAEIGDPSKPYCSLLAHTLAPSIHSLVPRRMTAPTR